MQYRPFYCNLDFAQRTLKNLEFLEQNRGETFEITQLINSLLGILIFLEQDYYIELGSRAVSYTHLCIIMLRTGSKQYHMPEFFTTLIYRMDGFHQKKIF